ncbi:MAG TPA: HNH endonuclease [Longimicrobiales bacterium]|nr:HNH endonuclease [Longimicrobiales bacterium]
MRRSPSCSFLRRELEHRIRAGRCAYCGAGATPERPLTREHVIPRSKGGRRKDARIIVPACVECNRRRGSQEIVLFLLARPRRIAAFIDYLNSLPPEAVQQIDLRVFAELYAAIWLLGESIAADGDAAAPGWPAAPERRLHRRRYAARRIVRAVAARLERARQRSLSTEGPSCLVPPAGEADAATTGLASTLFSALSLAWQVPAERVRHELAEEQRRLAAAWRAPLTPPAPGEVGPDPAAAPEDAELVDGTAPDAEVRRRRPLRRRRVRVDRRRRVHCYR